MLSPEALGFDTYARVGSGEVLVLCPFHGDHHASMSVNLYSGYFHCFSCGASGGPGKLIARTGGKLTELDYIAELELVSREEREVSIYQLMQAGQQADSSNAYLISRGIEEAEMRRYRIMDYRNCVGIPLYDREEKLIGIQMRNTTRNGIWRYRVIGSKPNVWHNRMWTPDNANILIVEGIFAAIRLCKYSIAPAVATMGAGHDGHIELLPDQYGRVMFDNDEAGRKGAARILVNTLNCSAYMPGVEADELDGKKLLDIVDDDKAWKEYPADIAQYSTDPRTFEEYVHKLTTRSLGVKSREFWL